MSDPEFDWPPPQGPMPADDVLGFYQRLVVNPFLALGCACLVGLVNIALRQTTGHNLTAPVVGFGWIISWLLVQYHCLDCGATGSFHRRKRHACPKVRGRWLSSRSPGIAFFPTATFQLVCWLTALFLGGLLVLAVWAGG